MGRRLRQVYAWITEELRIDTRPGRVPVRMSRAVRYEPVDGIAQIASGVPSGARRWIRPLPVSATYK